ncbi:MAG: EAL domain-containing protein [Epsilonproteobacteria bacterium]|nr:EAL domain-containing protein [Campylobacterota bacterium]
MQTRERKIKLLTHFLPVIFVIIASISILAVTTYKNYMLLEEEEQQLYNQQLEKSKLASHDQINRILTIIEESVGKEKIEFKQKLKNETYKILKSTYMLIEENKYFDDPKHVQQLILNNLKHDAYDNPQQLLLIENYQTDGAKLVLNSYDVSEKSRLLLESTSFKSLKMFKSKVSSALKNSGYFLYTMRNKDGSKEKMLAYATELEYFDWTIIQAISLNRIDESAQKKILHYIDSIGLQQSINITIYELNALFEDDAFTNILASSFNHNNKNSTAYKRDYYKQFQSSIQNSKDTFHSNFNGLGQITTYKIFSKFNWIVTSEIFLSNIETIMNQKRVLMSQKVREESYLIATISMIIILLAFFFSKFLSRAIQKIFTSYQKTISEKNIILRKNNRLLKQQLLLDTQTMLKNKQSLKERLSKLSKCFEHHAIFIIKIEDLKVVNELYGDQAGDTIILEVSKNLLKLKKARKGLSLYRLESGRFAILIREAYLAEDYEEALVILRDVQQYLGNSYHLMREKTDVDVNFTIGYAVSQTGVLKKAQKALSLAELNKQDFVFYQNSLDDTEKIAKNIYWRKELKKALDEDRVVPFYQPIVDKTGKIVKYEALVRMIKYEKSERKIISPYFFLDIAMKAKLYPALTKSVIRQALKEVESLDTKMSINLSAQDFVNQETVKFIKEQISSCKKPEQIVFEITESEAIEDFNTIKQFIKDVRAMGVKIAIDDFGSGYSNFANIIELKPDFLKIDGSLIKEIDTNMNQYLIVKAISIFAHDLGITTVAEFIENEAIFEKTKELGIDEFQGYYFYQPLESTIKVQSAKQLMSA